MISNALMHVIFALKCKKGYENKKFTLFKLKENGHG
jgi:hypothetical protein